MGKTIDCIDAYASIQSMVKPGVGLGYLLVKAGDGELGDTAEKFILDLTFGLTGVVQILFPPQQRKTEKKRAKLKC